MAWVTKVEGKSGPRFHVGWRQPKGKRVSKVCASEEDALAKKVLYERTREKRVSTAERTEATVAYGRFVTSIRDREGAEGTVDYYDNLLKVFVLHMGRKPMSSWTVDDFLDYARSRKTWGANTKHMLRTSVKTFAAFCREAGIAIGEIVPPHKRLPSRVDVESETYTVGEARALLDEARNRKSALEVPIALGLFAAFDLGDHRHKTWADVDRRVEPWVIRGVRHKTKVRREVRVSPQLREVLTRHEAATGIICRDLPTTDGALYQAFRTIQKAAKVRQGGWHRLRHTCLTLLGQGGVDLATIRDVACHKPGSPETLKYLHTSAQRVGEAVDRLGGILAG